MYLGPDSVVRRYWELRESLAAPKAAVYYVTSGSSWADKCWNCGRKDHLNRRGVERCSSCGSQWGEVDGKIPKGKRPKGRARPGAYDEGFVALGTAVALIEHIPEPYRTLYKYHLDPRKGGYDYAIEKTLEAGEIRERISERTASRWIRSARDILGLRLRQANAMGHSV